MFFKVFVSRNDKNGDGVVEKSEFRGGGPRFDQMDKNENGKLDRAEIDEFHAGPIARAAGDGVDSGWGIFHGDGQALRVDL